VLRVSLAAMGKAKVLRLGTVTSTQDVARDLPIGSIVIADRQTAGRGRGDHRWEAPFGTALLVSFVLEPSPLLSIAAGVAAAEACGKAVCGIGINLQWAPEGAARLEQPRDEVIDRLRDKIEQWTDVPDEVVLARWRQLSDTLGRRVRVEFSGQAIEGVAQDIGPKGELMVDGKPVVAGSLTLL